MPVLVDRPIEFSRLIQAVQSPERGAIACFLGTVRNHDADRAVVRLSYRAYRPMAEQECQRILDEAAMRWPAVILLEHRLGDLAVGDVAVAVVAAAGHRDAAFEACRYVIETLKRRVPIWKQEFYEDGSVEWVDPSGQAAGDRHPPFEVHLA